MADAHQPDRSPPAFPPTGALPLRDPAALAVTGPLPNSQQIAVGLLSAGQRPLPDYELIRPLGRGGFGEVWRAAGPGGFDVALKFVPLGGEEVNVEVRALEVMRNVRHAHLLPMYGAWRLDGLLVIAMELAERTLLQRCEEAQAQGLPGIPIDEFVQYLRDAAKGLDFLNGCSPGGERAPTGIQHKDVKPQNLLLVGGTVKVADFGLARVLERSVVAASVKLTPGYGAPEFLRGQVTRWSDQYCLAVSYCQLRGGRLPFTGSAADVMAGHAFLAPDLSMLPEPERPVVARALAKKPEERWSNCREFVEELAAVAADPEPPPLPRRRRRWPWAAGGAAALLIAATTVVVIMLLGFGPPPSSRDDRGAAKPADATPEKQPDATPEKRTPSIPEVPKPNPVVPPPEPRLHLSPLTAVVVEAGKRGTLEVRVKRENCSGPLRLEATGPLSSLHVQPLQLAADQETAQLRLTADVDADTATATVRVTARLGDVQAEQTVQVTVRGAPSLRLLDPGRVTLEAGKGVALTIRLERRNCSEPATLRLRDLPEGVEAASNGFSADEKTGRIELNASDDAEDEGRIVRLDAAAGATTAAGTFVLTIRNPKAQWRRSLAAKMDSGRTQLQRRAFAEAVAIYDEVVKLDPGNAEAHCERGVACYELNKLDEAIESCNRAVRFDRGLARAYYYRGAAYRLQHELSLALEDCNLGVAADPNDAEARVARAVVQLDRKRPDLALADADEAVRLNCCSARAYTIRANILLVMDRADDALAACREALVLDPYSADAYTMRGQAYRQKGDKLRSLDDCRKAVELDPKSPMLRVHLAAAYELNGDKKATLEQLLKAVEDGRNASAQMNLALYYLGNRQLAPAVERGESAVRLDPRNAWLHDRLAYIYSQKPALDSALKSADKAVDCDPEDVRILCNRGDLYWRMLKPDKAFEDYNAAVRVDPEHYGVRMIRGSAFLDRRDYVKAAVDFRKAVAVRPKSGAAHRLLSRALHLGGKSDEALKSINTAIQLDDQSAWSYSDRATLLWETNDRKGALADLDRAVDLFSAAIAKTPDILLYQSRRNTYEMRSKALRMLGETDKANRDSALAQADADMANRVSAAKK